MIVYNHRERGIERGNEWMKEWKKEWTSYGDYAADTIECQTNRSLHINSPISE